MFNERKAAQIATWFLRQAGGIMRHLKLIKLMYLAERQALRDYGFTLTGDQVVAMPHGPVLSMTLNFINGDIESIDDGWEAWISDRANHEVALRDRPQDQAALDELSVAELEILDRVWNEFGHMNQWQLRDYTHMHCPEWTDPDGSSMPIPLHRIFVALGKTQDEAKRLEAQVAEQRHIDHVFASSDDVFRHSARDSADTFWAGTRSRSHALIRVHDQSDRI